MRTVVMFSGGIDSTTLAYHLKDLGHELRLLTFDYGQRHQIEIESAINIAHQLGASHQIIDISGISSLFKGSCLTDHSVDTPDDVNDKSAIIPNRNAILLSLAYGYACTINANKVACGVHAGGDGYVYPDCKQSFINLLNIALREGTEGVRTDWLEIVAPFAGYTQGQIVAAGWELQVPFELTWSCYEDGTKHCGYCRACKSRKQAFKDALVQDPTEYAA